MSNDHAYLMHIRDSLHEVQTFIQGESYESFLENRMVQNAVMRSFEVGEAARRISPELREAHPEVPWRLMSDFRNELIRLFRAGPGSHLANSHRRYPGTPPGDREAGRRGMSKEAS